MISWDIDLSTVIGRQIEVETIEGIKRNGILTEVRFGEPIDLIGKIVAIPVSLIIDKEDEITLVRIKTVRLNRG
jgi:hypothetical protein